MVTSNKIIGYVLLAIGLAIIFWTLYQSYNIFTGKFLAPAIFKINILQQTSQGNKVLDLQQQAQQEIEKTIDMKISKLLPPDMLPRILNLLSWSILTGILIFGGGQIAGLGIKMIRPTA